MSASSTKSIRELSRTRRSGFRHGGQSRCDAHRPHGPMVPQPRALSCPRDRRGNRAQARCGRRHWSFHRVGRVGDRRPQLLRCRCVPARRRPAGGRPGHLRSGHKPGRGVPIRAVVRGRVDPIGGPARAGGRPAVGRHPGCRYRLQRHPAGTPAVPVRAPPGGVRWLDADLDRGARQRASAGHGCPDPGTGPAPWSLVGGPGRVPQGRTDLLRAGLRSAPANGGGPRPRQASLRCWFSPCRSWAGSPARWTPGRA